MSTNNMNTKRRVKLPGRFSGEEKWFVVRFDSDQELSSPVQPNQIEDSQSGETGEDKRFQVGDQVEATWIDGILYPGKIEFESEKKEDCLKYKHDKESKKKVQKRKKKDQNGEDEERPAADSLKKRKKKDQNIEDEERPAADSIKKRKKENNEQKKRTEAARKQTAVETAQELFKNSLKEKITALHDVSVSKNLTSVSIINTCTAPSTATNSTLTASSTVTNSTAAPSTVTNSHVSVIPCI